MWTAASTKNRNIINKRMYHYAELVSAMEFVYDNCFDIHPNDIQHIIEKYIKSL